MSPPASLTPFLKAHVAKTFAWVQDAELRRLFLMRGEVTWEGHLAYFAKVLADPTQRLFAVMVEGAHVGNCGLKHLDLEAGAGECWIYLGEPACRGKGVGRAATQLLLREALGSLGLRRLWLHVADFNAPARALYRGLGFVEVASEAASAEWGERGCSIIRMQLTGDFR